MFSIKNETLCRKNRYWIHIFVRFSQLKYDILRSPAVHIRVKLNREREKKLSTKKDRETIELTLRLEESWRFGYGILSLFLSSFIFTFFALIINTVGISLLPSRSHCHTQAISFSLVRFNDIRQFVEESLCACDIFHFPSHLSLSAEFEN